MQKFLKLLMIPVALGALSSVFAEEPAAPVTPAAPAAVSKLSVEIKVGTGLEKYDPTGVADSFPASTAQLVGWTRIKGADAPIVIKHVWVLGGEEKAVVELPVKSATFRTWSKKTIGGQKGKWRLDVKGPDGTVIGSKEFEVVEEAAAPAQVPPSQVPPAQAPATQK